MREGDTMEENRLGGYLGVYEMRGGEEGHESEEDAWRERTF